MKIAHIADTHLGNSQYRLRARKLDFFKVFEEAIDYISNDPEIRILVIAGDLFDSTHPDVETILRTKQILSKLGILTIIIPGNHDKVSNLTKISPVELIDLENVVVITKPQVVKLLGYQFAALPYQVDAEVMNAFISKVYKKADFLIYHGIVNDTNNEFVSRLSGSGHPSIKQFKDKFKYVFLGDVHIFMKEKVGNTLVVYSSSTENNSKTEVKNNTRGFVIYDTDKHDIEFIRLHPRNAVVLSDPKLEDLDNIPEGSMVYVNVYNYENLDQYSQYIGKDKFLFYNVQFIDYDIDESESIDIKETVSLDNVLNAMSIPKKIQPFILDMVNTNYTDLVQHEIIDEIEQKLIKFIKSAKLEISDFNFLKN